MDEWSNKVKRVEQAARKILEVRARYPDRSLAQLYDPDTMPEDLRQAHKENDLAVMDLYGFPPDMTEPEIVAALMLMYQEKTKGAEP